MANGLKLTRSRVSHVKGLAEALGVVTGHSPAGTRTQ